MLFLLNQESATGIYKTIDKTQRAICQQIELRPGRVSGRFPAGFVEIN
jgi:hypothetical protein